MMIEAVLARLHTARMGGGTGGILVRKERSLAAPKERMRWHLHMYQATA